MKKFFYFFSNLISLIIFFLLGCAARNGKEELVCIQLDDNKGIIETISSKERLKKFENINFLSPLPYRKVVRVFKEKGIKKSKITSYHENGNISQYLEVENGRAFGKYMKFHGNGKLAIEAFVIGGNSSLSFLDQKDWIFDKNCRAWDNRGNLISAFCYKNGLLENDAFYYFPDGKIKKIEPYKNGKIDGKVREFNENGKLIFEKNFLNGKKNGPFIKYKGDNKFYFIENWKDDLLIEGKYFDDNFEIFSMIKEGNGKKAVFNGKDLKKTFEYKDGKKNGKVKIFEKGFLKRKYFLKNGKKTGEEIIYYSNKKQPKLSIFWQDGFIQGTVKTWYKNGILESQKKMVRNKKEGSFTSWYKDGSLMFVEEYKKDILKEGVYYNKNKIISRVIDGSGKAVLFDKNGNFIKSIKYEKGDPQLVE